MRFIQQQDYVDYIMKVVPIKATTRAGSPITRDLVPGFHLPENIERIRLLVEQGWGSPVDFVPDNSFIITSPSENRRNGSLMADGLAIELGQAFNMMSLGFNSQAGTYFDTTKKQVGVGADGAFVGSEPNNNNFNPIDWAPADNTTGKSSSLTFPFPDQSVPPEVQAAQDKARLAAIGAVLKSQGWVE
jgi:hypothetical protein